MRSSFEPLRRLVWPLLLTGWLAQSAMAADVNRDALMSERPAQTLSEYNLFADPVRQIPNDRLERYELTNPLFTDYAEKYRFIYLPPEASPAPYSSDDPLAFPVGSAIVKTFAYPADLSKPGKELRLIETRLLIHKADGWEAWPYIWNDEMTEARLKVAGRRLAVPVIWGDGETGMIDYHVPSALQCKGCHVNSEGKLVPIGPKVRNLNLVREYADGERRNQLDRLVMIGYLSDLPAETAELPRIPRSFDAGDGTLAERARGYLDGNCAHCHAPGLPGDTSGLYLNYAEDRPVHLGVRKRPVAAGRGSGGLAFDILPGKPEESILLFRMESTDPGIMMPELGRSTVHREGIELIREYIRGLD